MFVLALPYLCFLVVKIRKSSSFHKILTLQQAFCIAEQTRPSTAIRVNAPIRIVVCIVFAVDDDSDPVIRGFSDDEPLVVA